MNEDTRFDPPIQQIVFYQSGIGSERNLYDEYVDGNRQGSFLSRSLSHMFPSKQLLEDL